MHSSTKIAIQQIEIFVETNKTEKDLDMLLDRLRNIFPKRSPLINEGYITIVYDANLRPYVIHDSLSQLSDEFLPKLDYQQTLDHELLMQEDADPIADCYIKTDAQEPLEPSVNPASDLPTPPGWVLDIAGNPFWTDAANSESFNEPGHPHD